jgi:hypothetical protein
LNLTLDPVTHARARSTSNMGDLGAWWDIFVPPQNGQQGGVIWGPAEAPIWIPGFPGTGGTTTTSSSGHSAGSIAASIAQSVSQAIQAIMLRNQQTGTYGQLPPGYSYNAAGQVVNTATGQVFQTNGAGLTGSLWQKIAGTIGVTPDTLTLLAVGGVALWALPSFRGKHR